MFSSRPHRISVADCRPCPTWTGSTSGWTSSDGPTGHTVPASSLTSRCPGVPDIQEETLSCCIRVRGFQALAEARITSEYFTEDNAAVFDWMREHWSKYGESPSQAAYDRAYPDDPLVPTAEPLAYYIDELREAYRYVRISAMLDGIKDPLQNHDTGIVLKLMAAGLESIHTDVADLVDNA